MKLKLAGTFGLASIAAISVFVSGSFVPSPVVAQNSGPRVNDPACTALLGFKQPGMIIESAALQPANAPVSGANGPSMTGQYGKGAAVRGLPAFCRVKGSLHPEAGSDIKFEAWLPQSRWDGRYTGANSGGLAGAINYLDLAAAVRAGQATSGSDTGHAADSAVDGRWARDNPQKIRDYGWRAVHLTTIAGKKLAEAFYGRKPDKSYFIGCSNGGRQALMEAARFPEDYDGIIVGAPAIRMTAMAPTMFNVDRALSAPSAALSNEQVGFIQTEVRKQCDSVDGQLDGLLEDPRQCNFDYTQLSCGSSNSSQCLSAPQLGALKRIVKGVPGRGGRMLAHGFLLTGGEVGNPVAQFGWDGNVIQRFRGAKGEPSFAETILENFTSPPISTPLTYNFKRDDAKLRKAVGRDIDATPDLSRFFNRGGKMILWHGWSDAILPPQATIDLHSDVLEQSGAKAKYNLQFFLMPGVQHCMGGPGADAFGQIGAAQPDDIPERSIAVALQQWVENGRVPKSLIGRRNGITSMYALGASQEKQRLHCAWPAKAALQLGADPDVAASYTCKAR